MQRRDVVVVGGGIAGLACGALLARRGRTVTVLEGASSAGGLARTRVQGGFCFNRGAHALYRGGAAHAVLESLGIALRGQPPTLQGVAYHRGASHRLPTTTWTVLTTSLLSLRGRMAIAKVFAGLGAWRGGQTSAAAWVEANAADASARAFLAAMLRLSTYCGDLEAIDAGVAVAALRQASNHGVLYLDGGWQQLVDALLAVCERHGVELRTRAPVDRVDPHAVTLRDGTRLEATDVVLAVPPSVAARFVDVPSLHAARVACLDVALSSRPAGPAFAFDLDDPMYLSVHGDVAALGPGTVVHTLHYGAPEDARVRLEGLLDRALPAWRDVCVHAQFLPSITVTAGVVPPGGRRPGVRAGELWRVGDGVGDHGVLADAAFGSAREVAHAILSAANSRAA